MQNTDKTGATFADGLIVKDRNPNCPDYIIANLAVNVDEFISTLQANRDARGWTNIVLKQSSAGKNYAVIDQWKPEQQN